VQVLAHHLVGTEQDFLGDSEAKPERFEVMINLKVVGYSSGTSAELVPFTIVPLNPQI